MNFKLLIKPKQYWQALKEDILSAKTSIFIQTFSFEEKNVGQELINVLKISSCSNIRILIDSYSKYDQNLSFLLFLKNIPKSLLNKNSKFEQEYVTKSSCSNIKIKYINPVGPFFIKFLARNHKKLIIIDDIVYIGGRDFSRLNFHWHDAMIRISDRKISNFFRNDFISTWQGINQDISKSFPGIEFLLLNGKSNHRYLNKILKLIRSAKKQIYIHSPYLTFPIYESLRCAKKNGVKTILITSEYNNRRAMHEYSRWECRRSNIDLRLFKNKMSHLKAILIDNKHLIVGSWNFDYLGYRMFQEIVAIITDPELIADFNTNIIQQDLDKSQQFTGNFNFSRAYLNKFVWQSAVDVSYLLNNTIPNYFRN